VKACYRAKPCDYKQPNDGRGETTADHLEIGITGPLAIYDLQLDLVGPGLHKTSNRHLSPSVTCSEANNARRPRYSPIIDQDGFDAFVGLNDYHWLMPP
jgi:hypothetical protein